MSMLGDLYTKLTTTSSVTDLVSTKIYKNQAPQNVSQPYIIFRILSERRDYVLARNNTLTTRSNMGHVTSSIEIGCFSLDPLEAYNIREAVRIAIDGFQQAAFVTGGTFIRSCVIIDNSDRVEMPEDGSENALHVEETVYDISYDEPLS